MSTSTERALSEALTVATLIEAHLRAQRLGFAAGTTNWAANVIAALSERAAEQPAEPPTIVGMPFDEAKSVILGMDEDAPKSMAVSLLIQQRIAAKYAPSAEPEGALTGWKIEPTVGGPFIGYVVRAPNGYTAHAYSHDRNPGSVLFLLAEAIVAARSTPDASTTNPPTA